MSEEAVYIDSLAPGAVCSIEETPEGVIVTRNGNGSIVSLEFPFELHADESLGERIDRLAQELKDARREAKAAAK